eukprot:c33052_g1_i1.p1 GENE.c33052_g1_i1~~c33052_g1_i1.p1  ORF type:complete len:122 (-),score=13.38 c33052_g1_i1:20-385(-)
MSADGGELRRLLQAQEATLLRLAQQVETLSETQERLKEAFERNEERHQHRVTRTQKAHERALEDLAKTQLEAIDQVLARSSHPPKQGFIPNVPHGGETQRVADPTSTVRPTGRPKKSSALK